MIITIFQQISKMSLYRSAEYIWNISAFNF